MSSLTTTQQLPPPPPPPRWVLDLDAPPSPKPKSANGIADPPGYSTSSSSITSSSGKRSKNDAVSKASAAATGRRAAPSAEDMDALKMKKAWEAALAPAKSLPMSAVGMWMSGNTLQIFSIFMLFQLFKAPLQNLFNVGPHFRRLETDGNKGQMLQAKLVFILCNLAGVALGIWKIDQMGLLPTTRSDWLAWETRRMPLERAYPGYPI